MLTSGLRQLLDQHSTRQIVAAAAVDDDVNQPLLHNNLRMEQSVSLILLNWGDLRTKNALHNKTLVPISVPRIDMYVCLSCIISGKQSMFKFF
jgi:hypothetical protein